MSMSQIQISSVFMLRKLGYHSRIVDTGPWLLLKRVINYSLYGSAIKVTLLFPLAESPSSQWDTASRAGFLAFVFSSQPDSNFRNSVLCRTSLTSAFTRFGRHILFPTIKCDLAQRHYFQWEPVNAADICTFVLLCFQHHF